MFGVYRENKSMDRRGSRGGCCCSWLTLKRIGGGLVRLRCIYSTYIPSRVQWRGRETPPDRPALQAGVIQSTWRKASWGITQIEMKSTSLKKNYCKSTSRREEKNKSRYLWQNPYLPVWEKAPPSIMHPSFLPSVCSALRVHCQRGKGRLGRAALPLPRSLAQV